MYTINKSFFGLIFINTILFFLCTIIIWKLFPRARFYTYGGITFILLILIATNACILYYDQKMQSQKQELDTYKKNLPIYEALITEICTALTTNFSDSHFEGFAAYIATYESKVIKFTYTDKNISYTTEHIDLTEYEDYEDEE